MILRTALAVLCTAAAINAAFSQELPRKALLGVGVQPIPADLRAKTGLSDGTGLLIHNVIESSSARAAGLEKGDIITEIAGVPVRGVQQFLLQVSALKTGDTVECSIYRSGQVQQHRIVMQPKPQEQYPGVDVSYGDITSAGNRLRTIFTRPASASGRTPVLYIIQGVDCGSIDLPLSRDHVFARFIEYFSARGFATYRVEKSGVGDSRGEPCTEMDFESETRGFAEGLARLKGRSDIDPDEIYIVGLSMGGVTAPVIAAQNQVKGVIVWGTVLRPWSEYMLENSRRQLVLAGIDYAEIETRTKDMAQAMHHIFATGKSPAEVRAAHPELAASIADLTEGSPADRPEFIAGRHYTFMQQLQSTNISAAWKQVQSKVLVLWGRADYVSDPDDHQLIADVVNSYRPGSATYAQINADHWHGTADDPRVSFASANGKPLPFSEELLPLIDNWLKKAQ